MAPELSGDPDRRDLGGNLGPSHFLVVLPLEERAGRRVYLNGPWRSDEITVVEAGSTEIIYLGCCLAERQQVHHTVARALSSGHLAELTELPGSFHVLVSSPEMFAAFGDVAGLRQVFYTRLGRSWLVSDRADVLARQTGASLSDEWLALWLVWPPPELWLPQLVWEGVGTVPPGSFLTWQRDNPQAQVEPRIEPYWMPPTATLRLEEGAHRLADALSTAVGGRVRRAASPSCDLSGGKDTTTLAFLADEAARERKAGRDTGSPVTHNANHGEDRDSPLLAITLPSVSPDNDDIEWARAVAGRLATVDHLVIPEQECPLPYDDLGKAVRGLDHPTVGTMLSAHHRHVAARLTHAGRGDDHISGHGGDEVLEATPAYVRSLLPTHPILAAKRLYWHCALDGISTRSAVRRVLGPGSYSGWLKATATSLAEGHPLPHQAAADFGWGTLPPIPPWLTEHAARLAAGVLERAAETITTPSGNIADHTTLARLRAGAATARLHQQFMADLGVRLHCPYFDRQVIEAALSVRAHERTNPAAFKPLLDAASTSTVPERFRARTTKGDYTDDVAQGLYRNRTGVAEVIADARLADRGLIDASIAQRANETAHSQSGTLLALTDMLSCERWLRAVEDGCEEPTT